MDDEQGTFLEELLPEDAGLAARSRNPNADVILVAGLGGDAVGTWRAEDEQKTLWPISLLLQHKSISDMNVRIMTFRYNSTLQGSASAAGIRDHANVLLAHLANQREDSVEARMRPIVFVGHSLGGMIIKQAITFAHRYPRFKHLWEASRGIMFFSTPHYEMHAELWYSFVRYVLQLDEPDKDTMPTAGMLSTIAANVEPLSDISEDFESRLEDFKFVTFLETDPAPKMNCVFVDKIHGRLRAKTEEHSYLEGDHRSICRFGPNDEDLFFAVAQGIKNLIKATPKQIDLLDHDEKKAYYSMASDETHSFFLERKSTPGTCSWTDRQPDIQAFLDGIPGQQNLWICGPPACGKTFLAKHIIHQLNPLDGKFSSLRSRQKPPTVVHYFVSSSLPGRGNLHGLLRATAHQALRLKPSLIDRLLPSRRDRESKKPMTKKALEREILAGDKLKMAWPGIMAEVTEKHALAVVIDGFDELDAGSRRVFLDCLHQFRGQSKNPRNLQLLFLSRELAELEELGFAPADQMTWQRYNIGLAQTGSDISNTIDESLERLWRSRRFTTGKFRQKIRDQIHLRSNGTYLWAALLSQDLDRNRKITSPADVEKSIQELPVEADSIPGLYDYILDRFATIPHVSAIVRQALIWASVQKEGLKPDEFNIAQAIGRALEDRKGGQITQDTLKQYLDDKIAMTLDFHCGHIVKFQDGRLELVHGSLSAYILQNGVRIGDPGPLGWSRRGIIAERLHAELARTCVTYLTMPQFQYSGPRPERLTPGAWETKVRKRLDQQHFSRYTSLYWDQHIREAGPPWRFEKPAVLASQQLLKNRNTEYARCWTEIWWLLRLWPEIRFPSLCPVEDILPLGDDPKEITDAEEEEVFRDGDGAFEESITLREISASSQNGLLTPLDQPSQLTTSPTKTGTRQGESWSPSSGVALAKEVQPEPERLEKSTGSTGSGVSSPPNRDSASIKEELPMSATRASVDQRRSSENQMSSIRIPKSKTPKPPTEEGRQTDRVNKTGKPEIKASAPPQPKKKLGWWERFGMAKDIIVGGFYESEGIKDDTSSGKT